VNDLDAVRAAIAAAQEADDQPSLIRMKTIIGWPAPNKMGTSKAHGSPLGEDEVRAAKEALGWDPDAQLLVPDGVYEAFSAVEKGAAAHAEWTERYLAWRDADAERAAEWDAAWRGEAMPGFAASLPTSWEKDKLATRSAGQEVMAAFGPHVPTMVGGAADLSESTKTEFTGQEQFTREHAGRNVFFGVREHGMGGTVNGLAAHGGIVRPYGSTFLQFADYMRGAVRLSALTGLPVTWVWTHDSVGLGEDGPTHQPVEHLAALRAIPGLVVLRPADAAETAEAWRVIVEDLEGPAALILSRQNLPVFDHDVFGAASGVARGAYVLVEDDDPEVVIVATGSEVWVAVEAAKLLDVAVRVVSMPSWELFEQQDDAYQDDVLPEDLPTVSVEAAISMGWERWADEHVSIERFGASAPGEVVLEKLGFTPAHVAEVVRDLLEEIDTQD
jgi:transketolase